MLNENHIKGLLSSVRLSDGTIASENEVLVEKNWDGNLLKTSVLNNSNKALKIKEVVLFSGNMPLRPDTEFYGEGYQMLCQYSGTLSSPQVISAYGTDWDFFRIPKNAFNENLWTVYNLLLLSPEDQAHTLLAFTSCNRFSGEFRFKDNYMEAVMDTEDLLLEAGQSWELEEFTVLCGAYRNRLFSALAEGINRNHPPRVYPEIPSGWCSYYCMRRMTAEALIENAYAMAQRIPELKRIQIDGGYEAYNGDWLTARPSLGADMNTICNGIRKMGVEPAGYISPFIVETESTVFKEHPDWLVKDEHGNPYNEIGHNRKWYMMDGSHPEVQNYFRHIAKVMHDQWGIRYFKLDFLAYGALPGGYRYDKNATRIEAFRMGIKAIVDEVGHDSFILGCNAPFWPILGLIHGNRVTNDILRDWKHVSGNARELFWRNWQNGTLWFNDPDCIVLEKLDLFGIRNGEVIERKSSLTDDEFEFHKAFIAASGGMILSGDRLPHISEKNIGVLKKLLLSTGVAAAFDDTSFTVGRIYKKDCMMLCVFNWEESPRDIEISLNGCYQVFDFWTDEEMGTFTDKLDVRKMGPHSGRVLVCKPLR